MAQKSFKTRIEYGDQPTYQASTTWTPFGGVLEIKPPAISADEIDVSNLESPDEYKEVVPGMADSGESTFKCNFDQTQLTTLYSLFRISKGFRVTYSDAPQPSGSKLRFNGFIKGVSHETIQKDNSVEAEVTIRVVGAPSFQAKA